MAYTITHNMGDMDSNPPVDEIDGLLDELLGASDEHPDVAVLHESGWTLSAFRSGRIVYENVETTEQPRHQIDVPRQESIRLFHAVADGNISTLERESWLEGY